MKTTSQQILEGLHSPGKAKYVNLLYKKVFPKVRKYICQNSGNEQDALDIFQDAVVVLCRKVRDGSYNTRYEVDGFLYTVAKNLWINQAKRDKNRVLVSEVIERSDATDYSDHIHTPQQTKLLQLLIKKLGEKCFELLKFSNLYRMSNEEICEEMGFATTNSVKTQKYKCKQKLMGIIEKHPIYEEII